MTFLLKRIAKTEVFINKLDEIAIKQEYVYPEPDIIVSFPSDRERISAVSFPSDRARIVAAELIRLADELDEMLAKGEV